MKALVLAGGTGSRLRPLHDRRYSVDTSRIRQLGWSPATPFDEALDATIAWYRANEWWRPLKDAGGSRRRGESRA